MSRHTMLGWAVLVLCTFTAVARASYTFGSIDDPNAATAVGYGTTVTGYDGTTIVGFYEQYDSVNSRYVTHGFKDVGGVFTTIDDSSATIGGVNYGTYIRGVSGTTLVGSYYDSHLVSHGFIDSNGAFGGPIDDPNANTTAPFDGTTIYSISGTSVAGTYYDSNSILNGFREDGGVFTTIDVSGAKQTSIEFISGNTVAGEYQLFTNQTHGFVDVGGSVTTLDNPVITTYANAVSGISGNVYVGTYEDSSSYVQSYVDDNGDFTSLAYPGALSTSVTGIDGATIFGTYLDSNLMYHGFTALSSTLPEPASMTLLAICIGGLLIRPLRQMHPSQN